MSAADALYKFSTRQLKQLERERKLKRKNGKPELQVQREVMKWLKANGFSCNVVESKAVYSKNAGRYLNSQTIPGFSDIAGACPNGLGCFIELKAPGRRSTLRSGQRAFLMDKINIGCFAVVVDSIEMLANIWNEFTRRYKMEPELAKNLLRKHLPYEKAFSNSQIDTEW